MTDSDDDKAVDLGLAHRIDQLIIGSEKTAEQIAEDLDVSPAGISKWRRQGKIKKSQLIKLADYFGVSVDYLLTGEYQWGETPQRRAWIEQIEQLSPEDQRRIQAVFDAFRVADGKTDNGDT